MVELHVGPTIADLPHGRTYTKTITLHGERLAELDRAAELLVNAWDRWGHQIEVSEVDAPPARPVVTRGMTADVPPPRRR